MPERLEEGDPRLAHPEGARQVTETLKRLGDPDRAFVLRWLLRYYADDGRMMSPALPSLRKRIALDDMEYMLVRIERRQGRMG